MGDRDEKLSFCPVTDWAKDRLESEGWLEFGSEKEAVSPHPCVIIELDAGELNSTIEYLKSPQAGLHPILAERLTMMLEANDPRPSYVLKAVKNRKDVTKSTTLFSHLRMLSDLSLIAKTMQKHGATTDGQFESAVIETCNELSLGRTKVTKNWGTYKKLPSFLRHMVDK